MSQKKKTTAQCKRQRKAPSNQTGGTAWGKKAAAAISGKMQSADVKKLILLNFPYIIAFYMVEKAAWLYRHCNGDTIVDRLMVLFMNFGLAYKSYLPSFHPFDLMVWEGRYMENSRQSLPFLETTRLPHLSILPM